MNKKEKMALFLEELSELISPIIDTIKPIKEFTQREGLNHIN